MNIVSIKSILSLASASLLIIFSYKCGIWSRIMSSEFYRKYDNKELLLQNAKKNMFELRNGFLVAILHSIPLATYSIFLYFVIYYMVNIGYLPSLTEYSIFTFMLACSLFVVETAELMFSYNVDNQIIDENAHIHYNRPSYIVIIITLMYLGLLWIDKQIDLDIKVNILNLLDINTLFYNSVISWYFIVSYISCIVIIKPITRFIVQLEQQLFLKKQVEKGIKNKDFTRYQSTVSLTGTIGWIFTIIFIVGSLILMYINDIKFIPLGSLSILVLVICMFANTSGQRAEYLSTLNNAYVKKGTLYYRSSDGKYKKW